MAFNDYSANRSSNTTIGGDTFVGPNMPRNNVRPAIQQIMADGKELADAVLPTGNAADRVGKFLAFDAGGSPVAASGTGADAGLRSDMAATTGVALVGTPGGDSLKTLLEQYGLEAYAALKDGSDRGVALQAVINAAVARGATQIDLGSGTIVATKQITWPASLALVCGDLTIDMRSGATASDFTADAESGTSGFRCDGGAPTQLSNLSADAAINARTLPFATAQDLLPGDVIVIYDPADYSFNGARTYYRAGEMVRVARVDGGTVHLATRLKAAYTASSVQIWRLARAHFSLRGNLTLLGPTATTSAALFKRLAGITIAGKLTIRASSPSLKAIAIERCHGVRGHVDALQSIAAVSGSDYGLVIANSQDVRLEGNFDGERHGCTLGGGDFSLAVPNRNIHLRGVFTSRTPGIAAAEAHGNCEDYSYEGEAHGGMSAGGDRSRWRMKVFVGDAPSYGARFSEMTGFDHDFSGCEFYLENAAPIGSAGLIDFGGNGDDALYVHGQMVTAFTADAATDLLALTDVNLHGRLKTGDIVRVSSSGTLPGGLAAATNYYVIKSTSPAIKLATSLTNAIVGTGIDITSTGSGSHTLTRPIGGTMRFDNILIDSPTADATIQFRSLNHLPARVSMRGVRFKRRPPALDVRFTAAGAGVDFEMIDLTDSPDIYNAPTFIINARQVKGWANPISLNLGGGGGVVTLDLSPFNELPDLWLSLSASAPITIFDAIGTRMGSIMHHAIAAGSSDITYSTGWSGLPDQVMTALDNIAWWKRSTADPRWTAITPLVANA